MNGLGKSLSMSDRSASEEVTEDQIDAIDDFDDAFDYADDMGVDLTGLDDLEDMKERMRMHKRKGENNPKVQVETALLHIEKEDKQKRSKLQDLLSKTKDTLAIFHVENKNNSRGQRGSAAIEGLLKTEGATSGLALDFNTRINLINSGECIVVVSGETSAGKSTVLNLLLQEDILPTHTLSCTSVVTKIAYGQVRRARIVYSDRRRQPVEIQHLDKGNVLEQVMDTIFVKGVEEREQLSDVKEVQLYIPSPILKSGLVLVDTPGIGENDAMDEVITKFVENNQILGFIYVIKSDNAGGVQEDRLLNLIKVILEHQKKFDDSTLPFDPKCAIFLCNLWDNVKKDEANEVYQNAVRKLGQCWPNLDDTQVIRLSAKKAKQELRIDPEYIKNDYRLCLEGLKDIFQRAVDRRVKSTYKWIENILVRSSHHLKSLVKRIDGSERDLEDKMKEVFDKLQRLQKKSDAVIEDMVTRIREAAEQICNEFREYLRGPASRIAITQWIEDELPPKDTCDDWGQVKREIDIAISNRIGEQLEKWEQANQTVRRLEEEVVIEIRAQLHLLQDELEDIEEDIQEDDDKSQSSEDEFPKAMRDTKGRRPTFAALRAPGISLVPTDSTVIPIKLITKVKNPVRKLMGGGRISVVVDDLVDARNLKAYKENPCKTAKQRAEKKLKELLDSRGNVALRLFVEGLLERPRQYVECLRQNIPALIQSNEDLMNHIAMCRVDASDSRTLYESMMEDMECLRRHLMEYGQGYIYVDDFMGNEITINDELGDSWGATSRFKVSDILDSSSQKDGLNRGLARGLWTALQNGYVNKDGNAMDVAIRIYLPSAGVEHTFPEVARLRCLHNPYVAEFLGIYHSDSPIPAFVYENHLKSLRQFMKGFGRPKEDLPKIIVETAQGLEYLHRKKMVHMELNVNTITVTSDGDVKLTGGCLPRRAAFPLDKESIEVGDFVYLAPEVLKGELYVACADIYAMALLLFELFVGAPFSEQCKWRLDNFSEKVNPSEMLELETNLSEFSETFRNLIVWCLHSNPDSRPSTDVFLENVKQIRNEKVVVGRLTNRRAPPRVRRRSHTPLGLAQSERA